jgi:hypothetical protein
MKPMRSYRLIILFPILISTTWNARVEAQTRRSDEAVASTLNATLVGREVVSEVVRDHADDMRSIALLEARDHKDLAAPLRDKFKPDWRGLAEQRIKPKRIASQPFYFLPMISNYGDAVTTSMISGYSVAVRDLLRAGVLDKTFCEPEKLQRFLH